MTFVTIGLAFQDTLIFLVSTRFDSGVDFVDGNVRESSQTRSTIEPVGAGTRARCRELGRFQE